MRVVRGNGIVGARIDGSIGTFLIGKGVGVVDSELY